LGRGTITPPQSGAGFHPNNFSTTSTYSNRDLQMPLDLPNSKPTALLRPERQSSHLEARLAFNQYACSALGEGISPISTKFLKSDEGCGGFQALLSAPYGARSICPLAFYCILPLSVTRPGRRFAPNQTSIRQRVSCPTSRNQSVPLREQSSRLTTFTKTLTQGQARMPYSHNPRMDNRMN
jgi:hypothetical protein